MNTNRKDEMSDPHPRDWISELDHQDRVVLHHALRMLEMHPLTKQLPQRARITELADALWDAGDKETR